MRPEFQQHNLFRKGIDTYLSHDPNLSYLESLEYIMTPFLLKSIPMQTPGVYILTGARQVGKSTLLKMLIKEFLLNKTCTPNQVYYLPCDIITGFRELMNEVEHFLKNLEQGKYFYLFIDEVTYVKDWDRAIKYFADLGYFRSGSVLITGSDSTILQEGMKRFPGRRGTASQTDFHYYPLSFSEYVRLIEPSLWNTLKPFHDSGSSYLMNPDRQQFADIGTSFADGIPDRLDSLFDRYLVTGGFLTAVNEFAPKERIDRYIYNTYIQWVIGDFLKRNKNESLLKEVLLSLGERLGAQVSFQNITAGTGIANHSTVQDYLQILIDMDVLFILEALREDKLRGAPKKLKKIHFSDPFIAGALIAWARDIHDYWQFVRDNILAEGQLKAELIEGMIASLYRRKFRSFYIKADAEVDLSLITGKTFFPIEIKNSARLREKDLKQILKYKRGIIGYRGKQTGKFEHLDVVPLPLLALMV